MVARRGEQVKPDRFQTVGQRIRCADEIGEDLFVIKPSGVSYDDLVDLQESLDRLKAQVPAVKHVSLVVAWFGDDLRAGSCKVRPCIRLS